MKPDINLFLTEFVEEINNLIQTGLTLNKNARLNINSPYFICDTPARCHLKNNYKKPSHAISVICL